MKTLILLRHAKSSWANPEMDDIDRPLNKRGKRAAAALGAWFQREGWVPEAVLCSPSRRTRETCERLGLGLEPTLVDDLYEATPGTLMRAVQEADGKTVMLIGHNPGIAALAQILAAERPNHPRFTDYPTGAATVLSFDLQSWDALMPESGALEAFLTPHDLAPGP